jgi:type IX secretion system PorP/SprF family membrane protein
MKTLFKTLGISIYFICSSFELVAQQDEQLSQYIFNPLYFNPAYAGTRGNLNVVGVHRSQWVGMKGAPQTQFLSAHSPISVKNMALGFNLVNDKIGARNRTSFYGNYAYTLRINSKHRLNLGVSFGGDMMAVDFNKLKAKDQDEMDYLASFSKTTFNIGSGLYYHADRFYVGLSTPRFLESKLTKNNITFNETYTKRHYFLTGGYVHPINTILDIKTSMLLKITENSPMTMDINIHAYFNKKWWLGLMYRKHESIGMNFAFQYKESMQIGYAYDFPINGLNTVKNAGSHEIMLMFDLNSKNKSFGSPRYF